MILFGAVGRLPDGGAARHAPSSAVVSEVSASSLRVRIGALRCQPLIPEVMPLRPTSTTSDSAHRYPVIGSEAPTAGSSIQTVVRCPIHHRELPNRRQVTAVPGSAVAFDIDVRIREHMGNSVQDAADLGDGYWIAFFPVKKVRHPLGTNTARCVLVRAETPNLPLHAGRGADRAFIGALVILVAAEVSARHRVNAQGALSESNDGARTRLGLAAQQRSGAYRTRIDRRHRDRWERNVALNAGRAHRRWPPSDPRHRGRQQLPRDLARRYNAFEGSDAIQLIVPNPAKQTAWSPDTRNQGHRPSNWRTAQPAGMPLCDDH